jgi:hypothetical protein
MTSSVVGELCEMPNAFRARGNVSMVTLLSEITSTSSALPSEEDIEAHLRQRPHLVESWVGHSEDQRCSPSWYLARPGLGLDATDGWRVGYYAPRNRIPERVFPDEFSACAFFIARYVEQLAT